MLIESDLERMVMLDIYYHNKDIITLTSRKSYVNNFWSGKLSSEYKHG